MVYQIVNKKVTFNVNEVEGNVHNVILAWRRQARLECWTIKEINSVIKECMSSDEKHLLATLKIHSKKFV